MELTSGALTAGLASWPLQEVYQHSPQGPDGPDGQGSAPQPSHPLERPELVARLEAVEAAKLGALQTEWALPLTRPGGGPAAEGGPQGVQYSALSSYQRTGYLTAALLTRPPDAVRAAVSLVAALAGPTDAGYVLRIHGEM